MKTSLFWLLATASFGLVSAVSPSPRFKHGCVVLQKKIYCYGGGQYVEGSANYNRVYSDHFLLDLSQDFMINDGQMAWKSLPGPTDFVLEPNYSFGYTVLSPTSYLITSGSGYNDDKTMLKNKTTIYHADKDQWEALPTTANQSIGTTANIDNHGTLYLFGGIVTYTNTVPSQALLTLNIQKRQWSSTPLPLDMILRADHASAIGKDGIIYYVGGRLGMQQKASSYTWLSNVPLTSITTYDTATQKWGSISVTGTIPTVRNGHTFTYVPKTNQFILFGGKQGGGETPGTFDDICYTFDPNAQNWTNQDVAQIGSGTRFGHSAVLYMDLYLFIIFGADHITMSMNTFNVLNIETWTWLDNFSATGHPNVTTSTPTDNGSNINNDRNGTSPSNDGKDSKSDDGSLGDGAIIGIAVGAAAFAVIAGAGMFICYKKRARHEPKPVYKQQEDFVMDYEFDNNPPPKEFTPKNYIDTTNSNIDLSSASYPLVERIYHPDELSSTSTAPTYKSTAPIIISPTTIATLVDHGQKSTRSQYKPDLTLDDDDRYLNKPFATN